MNRWLAVFTAVLVSCGLAGCVSEDGARATSWTVPTDSQATYAFHGPGTGIVELAATVGEAIQVTVSGELDYGPKVALNGTAIVDLATGGIASYAVGPRSFGPLVLSPPNALYLHGPQQFLLGNDFPAYTEYPEPWLVPVAGIWLAAAQTTAWGSLEYTVVWQGDSWKISATAPCYQTCGRAGANQTLHLEGEGIRGELFPTAWHVQDQSGRTIVNLTRLHHHADGTTPIEPLSPATMTAPLTAFIDNQFVPVMPTAWPPAWSFESLLDSLKNSPAWYLNGNDGWIIAHARASGDEALQPTTAQLTFSEHGGPWHRFTYSSAMPGIPATWTHATATSLNGGHPTGPYFMDPNAMATHAPAHDGALKAIVYHRSIDSASLDALTVTYDIGEVHRYSLGGPYRLDVTA